MIRPSDFETHTVEVANNQPICIACMALLPRFTTASGHVGWPFDHSSERDCRMNVAAPGGAQVCRNCITLDSSEHHFNRGSVDKPIPCVPVSTRSSNKSFKSVADHIKVPPEYLDAARKHRVLARAVELCEKWDCPNIVIVEHTDNRTKIYGNLFNQIGGKSIKKFVRSQSRLPNVEKVENLTRDQVCVDSPNGSRALANYRNRFKTRTSGRTSSAAQSTSPPYQHLPYSRRAILAKTSPFSPAVSTAAAG